MTRGERSVGDHVTWDGSPQAVTAIREVLMEHTAAGTLRLVLQQLTLQEAGQEAGRHETIDAICDVGGNLVAIPLAAAVRADTGASARLDAALAQLRTDIAAQLEVAADSLEVILDADGQQSVQIGLGVEVSPRDLAHGAHPALRDGTHHAAHHSHALDDLRDRITQPPVGPLRRVWNAVTRAVSRR